MRALLLLAVATAAATLFADVFRTLRGGAAERLSALGGEALHRSEATVNGATARISVFGFTGAPSERAPTLARSLGMNLPKAPRTALLLTGATDAEVVHLLLLPADLDKTLAILIAQPPPTAAAANPLDWPDLPRPAGAEPVFTASLALTRTTLVSATVPRPPEAAAGELDRLLCDAGWTKAAPATPSFALYQRHNASFAALTQPGDLPGTARITLLQRLGQSH